MFNNIVMNDDRPIKRIFGYNNILFKSKTITNINDTTNVKMQ